MPTPQEPTTRDVEQLLFHLKLLALLRGYPGSITSYLRSPRHNREVGGHPQSLHLDGLAADVIFDADTDRGAALAAARLLGLHCLDEGDHVHFQARPPRPRGDAS